MQYPITLTRSEAAPHAVGLLHAQGMFTASDQYRTICAVCLGTLLAPLANGPTLGIGRKEHLGICLAAEPLVLPVPLLRNRCWKP